MIELEGKPRLTQPEYQRTVKDLREWMSQGGGTVTGDGHANAHSKATGGAASVSSVETPKYVPYLMMCCLMSGISLALVIGVMVFVPMLIESKVAERNAALETRLAEKSASVQAGVLSARQDARIALDKIEQTQVQLGAKGLVFPSTH